MSAALLYENHAHTTLCQHAEGECEDYALVGHRRGLKGVIFTCHNPLPHGMAAGSRMAPEQFAEYVGKVERAKEACKGFADVRLGMECDFLHGLERFLEKQLQTAPFEYVLGALHPQLPEYYERRFRGDEIEFQKDYFTHLADAAETRLFDALAHPDVVKNVFADTWRLEPILEHVEHCLDRIAATGVAMELNTSGVNKYVPEMNPSVTILQRMHARGIPVVIGGDAHVPQRVGDGYETALGMLKDVGYDNVSFFLHRRRQEISIDAALASLQPDATAAQRP